MYMRKIAGLEVASGELKAEFAHLLSRSQHPSANAERYDSKFLANESRTGFHGTSMAFICLGAGIAIVRLLAAAARNRQLALCSTPIGSRVSEMRMCSGDVGWKTSDDNGMWDDGEDEEMPGMDDWAVIEFVDMTDMDDNGTWDDGEDVEMSGMSTLASWESDGAILSDDGLKEVLMEWKKEVPMMAERAVDVEEAMMQRWREMVDEKEAELRRSKRQDMPSMLPAHLTGWLMLGRDVAREGAAFQGTEYEEEFESDHSLSELVLQRSLSEFGLDSPSPSPSLIDFARETFQGDADAADAAFVAQCQLYSESAREAAALESKRSQIRSRHGASFVGLSTDEEESVGIDLGTTNCAIAVVSNGKPKIIPNQDGQRVWSSTVSFMREPSRSPWQTDEMYNAWLAKWRASWFAEPRPLGYKDSVEVKVIVGEEAKEKELSNPHSTYSSTKRLIGRTASADELRQLAALDVAVCSGGTETTRLVVLACPALRQTITPIDVAAELIRNLVAQAENQLGKKVKSAVVTVPAYFDDDQRLCTATACKMAGLDRVQLLREPEAAALAYAIDKREESRIMVFDLGGGTFDVSILDIGSGVVEVVATSGDPRLGGDDWDRTVADWLEEQFIKEHGTLLSGLARRRILDAAMEAKVILSKEMSTAIRLPNLVDDYGLSVTLSRRKFEALTRKLVLRLVPPMQEVCDMAGIQLNEADMGTLTHGKLANTTPRVKQWRRKVAWRWRRLAQRAGMVSARSGAVAVPINHILLVGGATRMPCIGRFINRVTGLNATPSMVPEEIVALGAAAQIGIADGRIKQKLFNPYQHELLAEDFTET